MSKSDIQRGGILRVDNRALCKVDRTARFRSTSHVFERVFMFNSEPRNIGGMGMLTPSVKFLIILNVAVFALEYMLGIPLSKHFALHANWWSVPFGFGQLFTYMFIHAGSMHLLANMLTLFFIGPTVEHTIGSYRFFVLYYVSGILGGLGWSMIADPYVVTDLVGRQFLQFPMCVGASGAVMGILGAFAALYPNARLLLWFILPIRAWVLAIILAFWELSEIVGKPHIGGIANAAHLVGGLAGCCYVLSLKHPHLVQELKRRLPFGGRPRPKKRPAPGSGEQLSKAEIDHILDKIGRQGMGALTPRERELLKRATR